MVSVPFNDEATRGTPRHRWECVGAGLWVLLVKDALELVQGGLAHRAGAPGSDAACSSVESLSCSSL